MEEAHQIEPFETRLIAINTIDLRPGHKPAKGKDVDTLAQSIESQGLLQPIGLLPGENGRWKLFFGRHRLAACMKLGLDVIKASVFDMDDPDADAAMWAENLFRRNVSEKERLDTLAGWTAHYKAKHPESFGVAALKRPKAQAPDPQGSRSTVDPLPPTPSKALAAMTGKGISTAKRDVAIVETLTKEQRDSLVDSEVGSVAMGKIARIKDPADRAKIVSLVASGMTTDVAIASAKAPDNATLEHVNNPDADGYKAESDMTDDEWLKAYCGDMLARLKYSASYRTDAVVYRQTVELRKEFKNKSRKTLAQSKVGIKGPLHYLLTRVVNLCHPKDWSVCGPCGGTGQNGTTGKCTSCHGYAYSIKTEAA